MTDGPGSRSVTARWTGGMRAVATMGPFEVVADEPESDGGTNTGGQPTDLLLASVATCFALAMAYAGRKRGIELPGLEVEAIGTYSGLSFGAVDIVVGWDGPADVVEELIPRARRVCYVTNTLRNPPEMSVVAKGERSSTA